MCPHIIDVVFGLHEVTLTFCGFGGSVIVPSGWRGIISDVIPCSFLYML